MSETNSSSRRSKLSPAQLALLEKRLRGEAGEDGEAAIPVRHLEGSLLPLSFAQQRLWFLDRLVIGRSAYNIALGLRLTGPLNVHALERSLAEIAQRHAILRTRFAEVDGQPVQFIMPHAAAELDVRDLMTLAPRAREAELTRIVNDEAQHLFDLEREPLCRFKLLRLADTEHALSIVMHHIVSDGWSVGILSRELAACYNAFIAGLPAPLARLPIQYADYAIWQRERLQGARLERQIAYWKQKLAGPLPVLKLAADRARKAVQSFAGQRERLALPPTTTGQLRALAQQEGATLFITLLAVFNVLLQRYTQDEEIVVGTPVANRDHSQLEPLIGFFVNTLVLRTQLDGAQTFREVLRRVKETALEAYEYQGVPFEKLVAELHPARNLSHTPLFQVMFQMQNMSAEHLELAGLQLGPLNNDFEAVKFDLTLLLIEQRDTLLGWFRYNSDLFDAPTIRLMCEHFQRLAADATAHPDRPLSMLTLSSEEKRAKSTTDFNQDLTTGDACPSVLELFSRAVQRFGPRTAIESVERRVSYDELAARAQALASALLRGGARKGSVVAVLSEDRIAVIISLLGILKAGCVFVPLETNVPAQRVAEMMGEAAPQWLLVEPALFDTHGRAACAAVTEVEVLFVDANGVRPAPSFGKDDGPVAASTDAPPTLPELGPDDSCYVFFTSGSTGRPKGIEGARQGLDHFIDWETRTLGLGEGVRVSQFVKPTFDAFLRDVFAPLSVGGTICVPAGDAILLDTRKLVQWIDAQRINLIHCVPSLFRSLLNIGLQPDHFQSLRFVLMAGEPLLPADVGKWVEVFGERIQLVNLYGQSETTMAKFAYFVKAADKARCSIPIGRPFPGAQALVLDAHGRPCPPHEIGEIYVRTPFRTRGYYRQPELTREVFVTNPTSGQRGDIVYKTGDIGRVLHDGNFEFLGRKDLQVKIRGVRVELAEVENVLRGHASVKDAVVTARDDAHGHKYLCAYIVLRPDGSDAARLKDFLRSRVPEYLVPAALVVLDALPLTPHGKVDRKALPAPPHERPESARDFAAPGTATETTLAHIWADLLGLKQVGLDDDFFDLGGHSLLIMQLIARVRDEFRADVPLLAFFESPTVRGLAQSLEAELRAGRLTGERIAD